MTDDERFRRRYGAWALVAGASEGMGAAYAEQLAHKGLNLLLVARRREMLEELAAGLSAHHPVQVRTLALDLSQPDAAQEIKRQAAELEVGLLVYNAAASVVGRFEAAALEAHLAEVDTNIRTPLALAHHFAGRMAGRGRGGIILMSSLSSYQGSAYIANYAATKAYSMVLAEGLWEEFRARGVDVLACVAGATSTPKYLASQPRQTGRFSDATLPPETVVRETLQALGHAPFVIPGRMNRLSSFVMRHLLPRAAAIRLMGSVLAGMYIQK